MRSSEKLPHLNTLQLPGGDQAVIFGLELPYLPDFLADQTLLSRQPEAQLSEVLGRFVRFVTGLRKWRGSALALRYLAVPEKGQIRVALLARLRGDMARGRQMALDLMAHLTAFGLPFQRLHEDGADESSLAEFLFPFAGPFQVAEVRQREQLVPLLSVRQTAYVVMPYWEPAGAFLEPFEALLQQLQPVAINILIQPTELHEQEQLALYEAAHLAQTVADLQRRTHAETSIQRLRDPGAERVGRIYSQYREALVEPFLLLGQVASPDAHTAWRVARALSSAAVAGSMGDDRRTEPTGQNEIVLAQSEAELAAARRTFSTLTLNSWGSQLATAGKERFPYLVGAEGAAALFRFPVNVRAGIPGIAVKQPPPDFELGPREETPPANTIHLGNLRRGGIVTTTLKSLTRHGLITGFTGSGKTNTMLYLLDQLWTKHRLPFLVLEAAKKEYRGLLGQSGFADLLVFTLGDETTTPFRLNPFELLPGVRLEAHLGRLQSCFDGALPQFGILPSIVAEALERVYLEKGWRLTSIGGPDSPPFPTMRDFYRQAIMVSESRGYAGETYQNIRAAVSGRIGGLLRGSKGRMFGAQRSYPLDILLNRPVILELNDLNADDKALTIMFLLTLLREYREQHKGDGLVHVTVVEEAHNVMGNVKSTGPSEVSADTKGQAVQAFADLLSEVRAYGEGILIADQSPDKLLPDAVRNTNLQLAHQLRDAKDREAIARALIMDERQQEYLGKLGIGEAAVFLTGMEKATFLQVPEYKKEGGSFSHTPTDDAVRQHMAEFTTAHLKAHLPFDGCRFCRSPCQFIEAIEPQTREPERHEQFQQALLAFETQPAPENWPANWEGVVRVCSGAAAAAGQRHLDAAYCYLAHEIDFPFTSHMRHQFEAAYERLGDDPRS